jgi:hypothetical protein
LIQQNEILTRGNFFDCGFFCYFHLFILLKNLNFEETTTIEKKNFRDYDLNQKINPFRINFVFQFIKRFENSLIDDFDQFILKYFK